MTIAFRLPRTAIDRLAFAYSPLLEAVLSLHVLVEPKHHPVQHPWVRAMRGLSPALKREIGAFSFAYRSYLPAFLLPVATGEFPTFDDEITRLRALPPEMISFEFTEPLVGGIIARDPARLDDPAARAAVWERAAPLGPVTNQLIQLALDDPDALRERFIALLSGYWDAAFHAEWRCVEAVVAQSVGEAGRQIAAEGLYAFLRGLWPEVRVDPGAERFWLERTHEHEVSIEPETPFVLTPSVYVWPHVRVNCDPPWPPGLVFPAAGIVRATRAPIPPEALVGVLRALADDTRLRALRFIAERPRSTQELAPLVGITEAALSKHLRLLAEAGVLRAQREGYYVLYRLAPDRIAAVGTSVQAFLGAETDVPSRSPVPS
ncbi:MAG TPA: DUF5937 family protein [Chloroflexota bacterium]|nr:DUF5937 family protein [Chloroflexota bacterium]